MTISYNFKLLLVFFVATSLATLAGPLAGDLRLPAVDLASANSQLCQVHGSSSACSEFWYPAGPAMNTLTTPIFTDSVAEYTGLQASSPSIDLSDTPCVPAVCNTLQASSNFLVTAPIPQTAYYELEFMLANNFWGCYFSFGNSACGIQIRQGISHMIDKATFVSNEGSLVGTPEALDDPVPTSSSGSLPAPNPCSYDASFPQSGSKCIVGAPGGTAYHLANATGANGYPWLYAPGSPDLNAAAQHFVNAGVATGFNATTSVLTGISSAASFHAITFFIINSDKPRLDFGTSLESQICYLFTGSYTFPCAYLSFIDDPGSAFPGYTTSNTGVNLNWWVYTAEFQGPTFFDGSLYFTYNSRFVSGVPAIQPPNYPCSTQAVPTQTAANYVYLCSPAYDSLSSQMESAPCLSAPGDPSVGSVSNGPGADCPGTSQLSSISAGIQAETTFGANAFTIPMFERTAQFGYVNGWFRAINQAGLGLPSYFTWLNAFNPTPAVSGTIRQGFAETTRSVNPYIASTQWDQYIVYNVYDSLYQSNPLNPSKQINWMTVNTEQLSNSSLTYTPPAHTLTTYRFTLRPDLYFQDGRPVTSYDVAFTYLSMVASGANLGVGASTMTGVTVLNAHQFDISVNSTGPFVLPALTSLPIVPGRYWTNAGSTLWGSATMTCTTGSGCPISQYTLTGSTVNCSMACTIFTAALMTVNPSSVVATFDPIVNHVFVGSGPWQCGTLTGTGSGSCTPSGSENPGAGGSYTLIRYGNGLAPASSVSGIYFRSSGDLALYVWSEENDVNPLLPFTSVASCFNVPVNLSGSCAHWQQGIGNAGTGTPVGISQVAAVARFYGVNWVAPYEWATTPPTGIGAFPPVLYEGSVTLNPASSVGCPNGYDC